MRHKDAARWCEAAGGLVSRLIPGSFVERLLGRFERVTPGRPQVSSASILDHPARKTPRKRKSHRKLPTRMRMLAITARFVMVVGFGALVCAVGERFAWSC
jgi:hypothetical protein